MKNNDLVRPYPVAIIGPAGRQVANTVVNAPATGHPTVLELTRSAAQASGVRLELVHEPHGLVFVQGFGSLRSNGMGGWTYAVETRSGRIFPVDSADRYSVEPGSRIVWVWTESAA